MSKYRLNFFASAVQRRVGRVNHHGIETVIANIAFIRAGLRLVLSTNSSMVRAVEFEQMNEQDYQGY